jgi:hypothetical protein
MSARKKPAAENPYESLARLRKVLRILAVLPPVASPVERSALCLLLGTMSAHERVLIAAAAGVNPPSETTWALVLQTISSNTRSAAPTETST